MTSTQSLQTPTIFSSISHMSFNPLSGVQSPHSRSFKWGGRLSTTHQDMCFTRTQSSVASQKSASITISSTRSWFISLVLVCSFYLYKLILLIVYLVLHPYYKLAYIKMVWGGLEEQRREQEAGNPNAKNWCDEALKTVEKTMEEYWNSDIDAPARTSNTSAILKDNNTLESKFDRHHHLLLTQCTNSGAEGWATELHCYLGDLPADVTKETNIVDWWAVSTHIFCAT